MIELRKSPRTNVIWRAAIKLGAGKIVPAKVVNVSATGVLLQSSTRVEVDHEYQVMMEVPKINQTSGEPYQVLCKVMVLHAILSGDQFRIGVKFTELSDLHRNLIAAWLSIATKVDELK
jgi:hypothetical protein